MSDESNDRTLAVKVLLTLQVALLREVGAQLRRVSCKWDSANIFVFAYFDGEVSDDDRESMSCVETEVIAAFPDFNVRVEVIRCDGPNAIENDPGTRIVFGRKEANV